MRIGALFSFKRGRERIESQFPLELDEIKRIISTIRSADYRTKMSLEKTMPGRLLYNPRDLNAAYKTQFTVQGGWRNHRVLCDYSTDEYLPDYTPKPLPKGAYREMDFVKNRLGVEIQFGKYAFMVYNVCAKMTIFRNQNVIDAGVEVIPMRDFAAEMSSGIAYFEQFVWDLKHRGEADIDVPVLIVGVTSDVE